VIEGARVSVDIDHRHGAVVRCREDLVQIRCDNDTVRARADMDRVLIPARNRRRVDDVHTENKSVGDIEPLRGLIEVQDIHDGGLACDRGDFDSLQSFRCDRLNGGLSQAARGHKNEQ
jgi:hypothetical protein